MKKILCLLLGMVLCLLLFGCTEAPEETTVTQQAERVGLCLRQREKNPVYYDGILAGLQEAGYDVIVQDGSNDQSLQDQQVKSLLDKDCSLLIVEPVMVSALDAVVGHAKTENIPLLILDKEPDPAILESYDRMFFAGCRTFDAGVAQGQLLEQLPLQGDLNEDGVISYMILRGPEDHMDAQAITEGCLQSLSAYATEQIGITATQWDAAAARAECAGMMARYGRDIEVIFCNHALLAQGAAEAVENRGWVPGQDVYILAVDHNAQLQQLIDTGAVFGTVYAKTERRVAQILGVVSSIMQESLPEKYHYVDCVSVTKP